MATLYENLITRRNAIGVELAAMSTTTAGGKPTYSADGQSVNHVEYRKSLYEELAYIDKQINSAEGVYDVIAEYVP